MNRRALAVAAIALAACTAQARDVYRCDLDGGRRFTTTLADCPGGLGKLVERRVEPKTSVGSQLPVPAPPTTTIGIGQPAPPSRLPPVTIDCEARHGKDVPALRNCLRELRRADLRPTLQLRLVAMSRAVAEIAGLPRTRNGLLANGNVGRPAAWCEALLNDVVSLENLEVVDDENTVGPHPIVDPDFAVWDVAGGPVTNGYVTVRWKGSEPLVLATATACTTVRDGGPVVCNPIRYVKLYVHSVDVPLACTVSFIDFAYWPNWRNSMTPIQLGRTPQRSR